MRWCLALLAACAGPTDEAPSLLGSRPEPSAANLAGLTPEAREVSQIADRNGGPGLPLARQGAWPDLHVRERPADLQRRCPDRRKPGRFPGTRCVQQVVHRAKGPEVQIHPAGRYTVSIGYDNSYGETLDVNEVQGKDWDIAIHRVWLGAPSEHRDVRLRTPSFADKHITYGCIDVDGPTMSQLLERVPDDEKTPLYILPQDDRLIGEVQRPPDAAPDGCSEQLAGQLSAADQQSTRFRHAKRRVFDLQIRHSPFLSPLLRRLRLRRFPDGPAGFRPNPRQRLAGRDPAGYGTGAVHPDGSLTPCHAAVAARRLATGPAARG